MLTLRGEHFYFGLLLTPAISSNCYTGTCILPLPKRPKRRPLLARRGSPRCATCGRCSRMVWETSPPLVVATIVLRLLRALLPLAMLWVPKLIIDAVVGLRNA